MNRMSTHLYRYVAAQSVSQHCTLLRCRLAREQSAGKQEGRDKRVEGRDKHVSISHSSFHRLLGAQHHKVAVKLVKNSPPGAGVDVNFSSMSSGCIARTAVTRPTWKASRTLTPSPVTTDSRQLSRLSTCVFVVGAREGGGGVS